MLENIIKLDNLNFYYDSLHVIDRISLDIFKGEFISILGPSGCGKTTLLKLIGGLLNNSQGDIKINNISPQDARRNREFGVVFQKPILFEWRNVISNVLLPFQINKSINKDRSKQENHDDAIKMLALVGLKDFGSAYPKELSGGMQSRVSIARALIYKPAILLMDEPFGDLDEMTRNNLNLELLKLWKKLNQTIVFITHSITEAIFLSDRIVILSERPCTIKSIININIERPRNLIMHDTVKFLDYKRKIKSLIR